MTPRLRKAALGALALLGAAAGAAYAQAAYVNRYGDVHMDREINATDALAVLNHAVGRQLPFGYYPVPNGDVDGNGQVTAADALLILAHAVGQQVPGSRAGATLNIPEPTLRLVSINGTPVVPGSDIVVADSFVVTAEVTIPAGGDALPSIALYSLRDPGEPVLIAATAYQSVPVGTTRRVTFQGRLAAAGRYPVYLASRRYRPGATEYYLGDTARVAVTQSDVTPPVARITSPAAGTVIGGRQGVVMVTFTVSDDRRLYAHTVSGPVGSSGVTNAAGMAGGTHGAYVGLKQGDNVLRVTALDLGLNRGTDSVVVRYDSLAPALPTTTVRVLALNGAPLATAGATAAADSLTLTVLVEAGPRDTVTHLVLERWVEPSGMSIGGRSVQVLPGTRQEFTLRALFVPPGAAELEVHALARNPDRGWHAERFPIRLTQSDVTPPVVTVRSPAEGAVVTGDTITMVVDASDERGLYGYDAYLNGTNVYSRYGASAPGAPFTYMQRFPSSEAGTGQLRTGANTLTMVVRDRAGNETRRTVTVNKP